ncbi:MAG: TetR/AcrR family transcriptional regulator [Solirubrobacteraceae bacterium]
MPQLRRATRARKDGAATGTSSRSKRAGILETATEYFGEHGYEDSKWADVAAAVGIGSTALYHYYDSKLHCLYVIVADALEWFQSEFDRITGEHDDYLEALLAVLRSSFDLSDHEVLRTRLLVADQGLWSVSAAPRLGRRRPESWRVPAPVTSSSHGAHSWRAGWSRGWFPRPIRGCSREPFWGCTTACGTGTGHADRAPGRRRRLLHPPAAGGDGGISRAPRRTQESRVDLVNPRALN